jgi:hypothetical protein
MANDFVEVILYYARQEQMWNEATTVYAEYQVFSGLIGKVER